MYICFLLLAGLFDLDRMRHWTRHLKSRANDYDYEFPLLSILSHISPFSHTRITWAWLLMASIHCARRLPQVLLVSGSVLFDPPSFQISKWTLGYVMVKSLCQAELAPAWRPLCVYSNNSNVAICTITSVFDTISHFVSLQLIFVF